MIVALLFAAGTVQAGCFVEYKAKQDKPLNLHYGIIELAAACENVEAQVSERLSGAGWTLLTVLSASEDTPSKDQKRDAGDYFLRF